MCDEHCPVMHGGGLAETSPSLAHTVPDAGRYLGDLQQVDA